MTILATNPDLLAPRTASALVNVGNAGNAGLDRALRAARSDDPEEAAVAFESLLATMMVRELRRSLTDGFFGKGSGADTYEAWFDEHLGRSLARTDALGLAGMVRVSLERKKAADEAPDGTAASRGELR